MKSLSDVKFSTLDLVPVRANGSPAQSLRNSLDLAQHVEKFGFKARFEGGKGTNPEELIGAAHAGCFSMAFSMILGDAGLKADSIDTQAEVTLDQVEGGFAITAVHLVLKAKIPGASQAQFDELSKKAKEGCPVSKVLNAKISLDATLVN
jgi:osmotically inducible protein OsmC